MSSINLNGSRILITNDDGYNADGIKILYELAKTYSEDAVSYTHLTLPTILLV